MSLRFRLSALITLVFLMVLLGSGYYVIENARRAIAEEMNSTASLTLQLIEIAFESVEAEQQDIFQENFLNRIIGLESGRHLEIELVQRNNFERHQPMLPTGPVLAEAPSWFIQLVKPKHFEFRRIFTGPELPIEIIIKANPSDEISEVWQETKGILVLLILFVVLSVILVYYTLGRGLKPIDQILTALEGIEQGDYRLRLPRFNSPELSRISDKFNQMAEQMLESVEDNKALTQKSLSIQEQERRHLAQELHDELGQSITAIKAVAASINHQKGEAEFIKDSTSAIIEVSNHMYDVAKNMMKRLRPTILDELGLVPALQDMVDDWNQVHEDIFCQFDFTGELGELGEDVNITLYRIIQESLTNVAKHSKANKVHIELIGKNSIDKGRNPELKLIKLAIVDDGVGYYPHLKSRGLGLLGMQERVESLNGQFQIVSRPNLGVEIKLAIPYGNDAKE